MSTRAGSLPRTGKKCSAVGKSPFTVPLHESLPGVAGGSRRRQGAAEHDDRFLGTSFRVVLSRGWSRAAETG
ncbi:MAG TPA: hypothetical protein VIL33_01405 [Rhodothermia bacterium]